MKVTRILAVATGLAVLACCACAPRAGAGAGSGPPLTGAALDLLTTSGGYPARAHVVELAEETLVQRCMAAHGQVYWPHATPLVPGSDEERAVDMDKRRKEGYGLATDGTPPPAGPNEKEPAFQLALFGSEEHRLALRLPDDSVISNPTTGCVPDSRNALYGDTRSWTRVTSVPPVFDNQLRAEVKNAPEVVAANARWASCMAAAGYPYASPDAAVNDVSAGYQRQGRTPSTRGREIAVATADGQCALQAHVPSTVLKLRRARAQSLPPTTRRDLNQLAGLDCVAYGKAAAVAGVRATPC